VKVVVLGAGFAGLAAAIALQEKRHQVTLLERRGVLGGRATSYRDALSGEDVDNGSHLMVGAYRDTLDLIRRADAAGLLLEQEDLLIDYAEDAGPTVLRCPPLPAPLHLLAGLLSLRLPWAVRFQALRLGLAVRFGRPPHGLTLAEYFRKTGQGPEARRLLWDPLAIAIVNEAPERAAAILFHRVYQEAFLASRKASRLVFLRSGWGVIAERLARYFEARGGTVRRRALVRAIEIEGGRVSGVRLTQRAEDRVDIQAGRRAREEHLGADAVVAAVPWHALPDLLPEGVRAAPPFSGLARIRSSPIVSVELWLDQVVVGPVLVGLRDSEVEWVFDKGRLFGRPGAPQHLSFIVSAAYRSSPKPNAELLAAAVAALRRYFPAMAGATVTRSLVMREPEATFSAGPETEGLRPPSVTPVGGLFLAGDWTATGLPATIEGAVRSGREAARVLQLSERQGGP
jgi:squalene-associated FAD-dependent desaturase